MNLALNTQIYVVHALQGYEVHEERVIDLFSAEGLSFKFITQGDPTLFTADLLNRYFLPGIENKLRPGILSCTLNHILAYEDMVQNKIEYAIVFENDPYFLGDFKKGVSALAAEVRALKAGFYCFFRKQYVKVPFILPGKKGQTPIPRQKWPHGRCLFNRPYSRT